MIAYHSPFVLYPYFLLTIFICAGIDLFKLIPLYYIFINRKDRNIILDFICLAIGDTAFIFVDSTKDNYFLTLGLLAFLAFICIRFCREINAGITRHWPSTCMFVIEIICLSYCQLSHLLLDMYAYLLLFLLIVPFCRSDQYNNLPWQNIIGYLLYAISDLLLVVSLNVMRFWGDWYLVRILYWMGIATLYGQPLLVVI